MTQKAILSIRNCLLDVTVLFHLTKEWKPRWGYKRINDIKQDWLIEVPDNAGRLTLGNINFRIGFHVKSTYAIGEAAVEHYCLLLAQVGCGEILICNMVLLVLHVYSHSPLKVKGDKNEWDGHGCNC